MKEKILIWTVAVVAVFLLFYWTHLIFASKERKYVQLQTGYTDKIEKTAELLSEIASGDNSKKTVTTGLLSFIQSVSAKAGVSDRILDLKPITGAQGVETAGLRIQGLNLNELTGFLALVEGHDNLGIKTFSLKKRFDDPMLVDINLELVKSK
jgi:hypothetical protein